MDLQTITKLMLSQDYKERMKGEYYHLLNRNWKTFLHSNEWKVYLGIMGAGVALLTIDILPLFGWDVWHSLRAAFFQASSRTDFNEAVKKVCRHWRKISLSRSRLWRMYQIIWELKRFE